MRDAPPLFPPQQEILDRGLLDSGFSCVLQMPTGSGKTWLAEQAIASVLNRGLKAIYLTPLRALATELHERWTARFAPAPVGAFTGETLKRSGSEGLAKASVLIMTPERLDACTRNWRSHWEWIPDIDLLVVDEFHLLGDSNRGARLEGTLSRFQRLNPFVRVLGLSATLGNRDELADWLNGVEYASDWRAVPLEWTVRRFRKADEKLPILIDEVTRCVATGGRSLVFVQSRRRAEMLATELRERGLKSLHHHAGLDREARNATEHSLRNGEVDVVVATGTLEMGMNLPVRQVVLFDVQHFDGRGYSPLKTSSVWQRAGRAGRFGLDDRGEAVLIAPAWDRDVEKHLRGNFEPIASALSQPSAVAEQILAEVGSGLARTEGAVRRALETSLAHHQKRLPCVRTALASMIKSKMIVEVAGEEGRASRLKATRLGRIAVRQMLSPETVLHLSRILNGPDADRLSFLDLLLIAVATVDCEPVLPVDFEEIPALASRLMAEPSHLLSRHDELSARGRRLLGIMKTAATARAWTRSGDREQVADDFNCYPFEVGRLVESLERVLTAMTAVVLASREEDDDVRTPLMDRVAALTAMIKAGLDEQAVTLTFVGGIGPLLARRLVDAGFLHIDDLALTEPSEVSAIRGVSERRAAKWIEEARQVVKQRSFSDLEATARQTAISQSVWQSSIDPYRLGRATELVVAVADHHRYLVTGGSEPRHVAHENGSWTCDCPDHARGAICKHILAVRLELREISVHGGRARTSDSTLDLHALWFEKEGEPSWARAS